MRALWTPGNNNRSGHPGEQLINNKNIEMTQYNSRVLSDSAQQAVLDRRRPVRRKLLQR